MAASVGLGPLAIAVRAGLRAIGGKTMVTRLQRPTTLGLGAGLLAAPALAGATFGASAAVAAAVLGMCLLLFVQDLAWRWLPLEWTVPLLGLGLVAGFLGDRAAESLAGAVLGAGIIWILQITFRLWRGVEAVGTGDIWLVAGLGCFAGPDTIAWVLGLAALSGLVAEVLRSAVEKARGHSRWGVAFGAHMIAVFVIVSAF